MLFAKTFAIATQNEPYFLDARGQDRLPAALPPTTLSNMDLFTNITVVRSAAEAAAAAEAMEAIEKNNAANVARLAGRYDEAIRLHSEALQAKIRFHGERSIQAAISFNGLGVAYLEAGKLDEAAAALASALAVRDDTAFGGMEVGPRNDAAASRDNMARVLEARGDFPGAREIRLKGADKGHTMCGCMDVSSCFYCGFAEHGFSVRALLIVSYSPTIVCSPRRRHAVPPTVESLCCVPFRLLLQPSLSKEGLDNETQAPLQEVRGFGAVSCQPGWIWRICLRLRRPSGQ